jgi:lipopolysaccharide cholinephosphotransferase
MIDLERAKKLMVEILIDIDRICKKNDINYWIDFGTLLGAVRHKGFIPWDDDIDISMPRKDYNRFLKVAQKELNKNYSLHHKNLDSRNYILATKVRHNKSIYVEHGREGDLPNGANGIFVDVFPLDRIQKKNIKIFNFLRSLYHISPFKPKYESTKTKMFNYFFSFLYPFRNFFKWLMIKLHSETGDVYILGHEIPFKLSYPYELVNPIKRINFERHNFNCPQQEEIVLKSLYGDFMKLPPLDQRRFHAMDIKFFD